VHLCCFGVYPWATELVAFECRKTKFSPVGCTCWLRGEAGGRGKKKAGRYFEYAPYTSAVAFQNLDRFWLVRLKIAAGPFHALPDERPDLGEVPYSHSMILRGRTHVIVEETYPTDIVGMPIEHLQRSGWISGH
jgi:hypothetical protein